MSVETITLGCRLNFAESEAMRRARAGEDDWVIVNSCAVTNEAVRQTRQAIRRAHRERPDARILVTGCAAAARARQLSRRCRKSTESSAMRQIGSFHGVDALTVAGGLPAAMCAASSRSRPAATIAAPSARSGRRAGRAARCRSRRSATRSSASSTRGAKEIVLTGVDITSYDEAASGALCQRLLAAVPRLEAPAPVLARQHRDRRSAVRADRRRAAAHAAFPSVASGRRRHDPQADEAPPQPRRGGRARSSGSRRRGPMRRSAPT